MKPKNCGLKPYKSRHLLKKLNFSLTAKAKSCYRITYLNLDCFFIMQGMNKQFHTAIELSQSNSVASKAAVCLACHQWRVNINQAQWNSRHSCNVKRTILDFTWTRSCQKITRKCVICHLNEGMLYRSQPSSDLPSKSFWRPTFYPSWSRLRRTTVCWWPEYHQGSKRIEQGICAYSLVDQSEQFT